MKSNDRPYPSRNGGAKDSYALAEPDWWADDVGSHFANEPTTAELTREMQFPDNVFLVRVGPDRARYPMAWGPQPFDPLDQADKSQ